MNTTMDQIQQLSAERHQLWLKAGHSDLSDSEYWRIRQITQELDQLWKQYRREYAVAEASVEHQAERARLEVDRSIRRAA